MFPAASCVRIAERRPELDDERREPRHWRITARRDQSEKGHHAKDSEHDSVRDERSRQGASRHYAFLTA